MSDDIGRFALNILAAPLEPVKDGDRVKRYLLDTQFLQATNSSTVSAAIVKCLVSNNIRFEDVITVNTDNAAYMKKAYNDSLKGLMPNSTHVTCMAHIMNLLGEAFRKPFDVTNKFVRAANAVFWNAGARNARYIRFMGQCVGKPKMPPNPVGTRWNCWFDSVKYHKEHLHDFGRFVEEEAQHCGRLAPKSLTSLVDIFSSTTDLKVLEAEMNFITEHCEAFITATNIFQSQEPNAVKAWSKLEDLHFTFGSGGVSLMTAEKFFPDDLERSAKCLLQDKVCMAFFGTNKKLEKYMSPDGQPGINFIKQIQFFDPSKLIVFEDCDFSALPGLNDVPGSEIKRYRESLGPKAVKVSGGISLDLTVFWNSIKSDVPKLAECALKYIHACLNSADAERSFSIFNLVFSERRRSLNEDNLRALVFLYYNNFVSIDSLM